MNLKRSLGLVAILAMVLAAPRLAAQSASQPQSAKLADSAYLALLRPLRDGGDTTVDMTALRRAFAATSFYSPYDMDRDDQRGQIWKRLDAHDPVAAAQIADSLLSTNYLDFATHIGAGAAALGHGDSSAAIRHFAVARAVIHSIESTGDGRSAEHPLFVIEPSEEYSYLSAVGLRRSGMQSLSKCGDRACDVLEVRARDGGQQFNLYFDVSLPMDWMTKQFSQGEKETKPAKP